MIKFLCFVLLLIGAFGAGYYLGQRPVGTLQRHVAELQQSLKDVSRNVVDTTVEIERDIRRRQVLVESKSRLLQAKAHVADRNFGDAVRGLTDVADALESISKGAIVNSSTTAIRDYAGSLKEVKAELAMGRSVPMKKLDELQYRLDQLLNQ